MLEYPRILYKAGGATKYVHDAAALKDARHDGWKLTEAETVESAEPQLEPKKTSKKADKE